MKPMVRSIDCLAPEIRWVQLTYSGKPRLGLDLGEDDRNIGCMFAYTMDGFRSFKRDSIVGERDVTTVIA